MFVNGTRILSAYIYKFFNDRKIANGFAVIIYLIAVIYVVSDIFKWKDIYAEQNEHIHIRQVVTAKWLHDNTPENSIIATHDVGAIGFYSERKVIDVAGLINPELITKLLDPDYNRAMMEAMNSYGVTHTAFLREWYRVVNSKPIFITGSNNLEIMEVHKYDPGRTYVMNGRANSGVQYALQLLSNKQFPQALNVFQQASNIDPGSSLIYFYIGYVYDRMNDQVNAEKNYKKALEIFPGFSEAAVSLADIYKKKNDISSSRKVISNILQVNPTDSLALNYFNLIKDTTKTP
jgi:tetratricopeptide (TPR) repeat protein